MRREADTPDELKPLAAHGVDLRPGPQGTDWIGDCPFCGKTDHLYASPKRGTWDCKVCGESGNSITFLTKLAEVTANSTTRAKLAELAEQRGIPARHLRAARVGWDGREWLVPVFSETGTVRDIRKYDGRRMLSTTGCKAQLWGAAELAASDPGAQVLLLEGEWDGIAARWMVEDSGEEWVCVAVPGATTFKAEWAELFRDRKVLTVYDHDDAGDRGQIKAERALRDVASELQHVCWPEDQDDGYDLRDFARERIPKVGGSAALAELMQLARPSPRREVGDGTGGHPGDDASDKLDESKLPDTELPAVLEAFAERLDMNQESNDAVEVLLAVALSNDIKDDPVWLYLMGSAGTGKTELLTSLIGTRRCVFRSTVTPKCLVSGFKGEGKKDPSLIPRLKGKTLVAKDFTEVLSLPDVQQKEIYSTLRGAFDGFVDKTFGNGAERHYKDCQFSIVAGVTNAILKHRESAMGERFLKFRLSRLSQGDARRRAARSLERLGAKKRRGEELQAAVAGYLKKKLPQQLPPLDKDGVEALLDMAEFISRMRVQVERDQRFDTPQYRPEPEGLDRVAKQLGALARTLAWMHGRKTVGPDELRVVGKIAFDTVCGFDSDIVDGMMSMGGAGTRRDISEVCGIPGATLERRMADLLMVGIVKSVGRRDAGDRGGRPPEVFEVREELAELWKRMKGEKEWKKEPEQGKRNKRRIPRAGGRATPSGSDRSSSSSGGAGAPRRAGSGATRRLVRRSTAA